MVKNNFHLAIWITWMVIILCLISVGIMIKVYLIDSRFDHEWDFLVYSIPVFISSIVFIMLLYNLKRAYSQGQTNLEQGNCIVHWKYGEGEWASFNLVEWKKIRNRSLEVPLGLLFIFLIIGILDSGFSSEGLAIAAPYVIFFLTSLSAILFFYNYMLYKRTKTCPREVLIGTQGFLYGGYYNTWDAIGTRFTGVKFISGNIPTLEFDIKVWGKYGYSSNPLRVPIPIGHEYEAEKVISELTK